MSSLSPAVERSVRCWCGHESLEDWSPDYRRCGQCETLVLREMHGEEITRVREDEQGLYGKGYYLRHLGEDYGYPDLETRARADIPERCLHWLRTLLKFVPGPGARTLELGCGHGGFVAMQRWAGVDATGLELSPWLVDRARDWFGVPVLQGRLEDQDLPAASYDTVALMDVLEHLPDPRQTIGRAVSLLRSPGGFLLIQTPRYPEGASYETLLAQDDPFLLQLKPMEHLYLFSERALARLCAEVGVGEVRFEPAIFAHYDLFAVASAGVLREHALPERTELLMAAAPPARWTLALLDLAEVRDALSARLAAAEADGAALRETAQRQNAEITRLHAVTSELWPKLDATENARNLAVAELSELQRQFQSVESDNAARLRVIESQGEELGETRSKLSRTASELAEMHGHFKGSEADRAARLEVIQKQGALIGELQSHLAAHEAERAQLVADLSAGRETIATLQTQLDATRNEREKLVSDLRGEREAHAASALRLTSAEHERDQLSADLGKLRAEHGALVSELETVRRRQHAVEHHWTGRMLKRTGLWPR